jgi:uncharacterized membrane protein
LTVHIAVSVGWLGLGLAILALGVTGRFSEDKETARAAYPALRVITDWVVTPVSVLALLTGALLALGTPWGLLRRYWVAVKFWLVLAASSASILALRKVASRAASAPGTGTERPGGGASVSLVVAPSVLLALCLFVTAVSVIKPWGLTRRGKRARELRCGGPLHNRTGSDDAATGR